MSKVVLGLVPKAPKVPQSTHEVYMQWWLDEAVAAGFVKSWTMDIEPFKLSDTVRLRHNERPGGIHLMKGCSYTPDFHIVWNGPNVLHDTIGDLDDNSKAFFYSRRIYDELITTIDVKPDKINSKKQSSYNTFPINQKLVWRLHGLYVQKTVLYPANNSNSRNTLFQQTWTPQRYVKQEVYKRTTKKWNKGASKIKWGPVVSINQFK